MHQPFRTRRRSRRLIAFVATILAVSLVTATVYAFFTGTGATTARASVGSLAAPTEVVATATADGSVEVTWGAVTVGGEAVDGYRVLRDGASACGTTVAGPATGCTDAPPTDGTYQYTVVAVFRSWTATSAPSAPVTVTNDATAPTVITVFPGTGAYNAAAWSGSTCAGAVCGTAHDDASGITRVQVSVRKGTGQWFDGSTFASATEVLLTANGTADWSLPFPASHFDGDATYTVRVVATDGAGNASATAAAFTYDTTAPTGTLTVPAFVHDGAVLDGTFADVAGSGVASVTYRYCAGASCTPTTTIGTVTGATAYPWSPMPADGGYRVQATVVDAAGNAGTTPVVSTTVDNTAPFHSLSLTAVSGGAALTGSTVYFKGNTGGGFRLVDTVSDPTAGAASVTYPALGATGWAHDAETVTGASPFTSAPYSWTNGAATPGAYSVTAHDNAGNSTPTSLTFANDTGAPAAAVAIAPADATTAGYVHQGGTFYVWANVSDAGSGVATVTANVGNLATGKTAVALVPGSYDGPNGTTWNYRTAPMTANSSLSTSTKTYSLTAVDAVGNSTGAVTSDARVDNTAPTITMTGPTSRAYNATTWAAACATAGACGSATDPSSTSRSQVSDVRVTMVRTSDGAYWDGSAWQATATTLTASGAASWSQPLAATAFVDGASYTVRAYATDNAGNQSSTVSATFTYDTTAPVLQSLAMYDGDADGKVDQLNAVFDEALASSNNTAQWQLANVPSNGTINSTWTSGSTAYVGLDGGAGAADTSVGSFTVALLANGAGVRDAAGNAASFTARAPADAAGPVAVSFASFDSDHTAGNGKLESGDYVEVRFSEPLAPTWSPSTTGEVTLTGGNGSGADRLDVTVLGRGSFSTGRNDYISGNGRVATFATTVTLPATNTVRVTLGACSGSCSSLSAAAAATPTWSFFPSLTLRDAAGNTPDGTVADNKRWF